MFKIGKVINYYEKTQMAAVELDGNIALGDRVTFIRNTDEFEYTIELIQKGSNKIEFAGKGEIVVIKVPKKISNGTYIYKKN